MEIKDKVFKPYISAQELEKIVGDLAYQINRSYLGSDAELVVCPVLTGSFMFASDLVKYLVVPVRINFIKYKSYIATRSGGTVVQQLPFTDEIKGQDVLIIEDIVDSGLTMDKLVEDAMRFEPSSTSICSLLFKPGTFKGKYKPDFIGREITNEFVVGYGMDYCEEGRNLPAIYQLESNE